MILLRSALFNLAFFGWTILLLLAGLPLLLAPRRAIHALGALWARGTLLLLRVLVGARLEVRGALAPGARLVAAKHQSALDTMLFYLLAHDVAYVMKKELVAIPIYGLFARHQRMILVDRKAGASALKKLVADASAARDEGRQIVIFPQGTRTPPGAPASAYPYQPGIVALQHALRTPTTPVAINSGLVWGRRSFVKRPGCIVVEFLPEIPAGLQRAEFMRRLEETIEAATARLEREAGAAAPS